MTTKIAAVIVALTLSGIPSMAQTTSNSNAWRSFAAQLEPNAFVKIKLANGRSLRAHVVNVDDQALQVNPKTRIAVPLQQIPYNDITSIERQKEPKWNPAAKVLLGVGIGVGALYVVAIAAVASLYGFS